MILVCQYRDHTWLTSCRIIDAFEDTVNVILQDTGFNLDQPLLVEEEDVALRAERVRLQWVFDTNILIITPITKQIAQDDLEQTGRTFGVSASDDGPGIY